MCHIPCDYADVFEEFWFLAMSVLERVDGRLALDHGLRELAIVEADVAQGGLSEVFAAAEAVALQDVLDPAVETLHHFVGLWPHRRGEAVLDVEIGAELVKIMIAGSDATAQAKDAVRLGTRLDRRPHLRRRGGLLVKRDQHARLPSEPCAGSILP